MAKSLKLVIPMAGWGTRMRPHTWSKPKPLVSVAGKTSLEHLMDMFKTLPEPDHAEYIFIVGPFLGETQIPEFIRENYPKLKAHYIVQAEMKGQSHALALARKHLRGPMLVCFSDSLIETDLSFLSREESDGVVWVRPVPDPRRFGVAEVGADGWVTRFIEKPQSMENNLAIAGCYYFKRAEALLSAIDDQMKQNIQMKGEFFLADAITLMIKGGAKVRVQEISLWLDTGTIEATLEANKVMLERGGANQTQDLKRDGVEIIAPSFIHETAEITNSVIGPFASIAANCRISNSRIEDSIVEPECEIQDAVLSHSLIGRQANVQGRGDGQVLKLNVGDDSFVVMG